MLKGIIFDFDGVLVDSTGIKTKAFARLFEGESESAVKRVVEYHLNNVGVSRFDKFRYIYNFILKRELTTSTFNCLCSKFSELVYDEVIRANYINGVEEFLKNNFCVYSLFIVSATPHDELNQIIKLRGMSKYFKSVYGAPSKKSDLVRKIIQENNLGNKELVYIGDAMSDFEAALENNVKFIAKTNQEKDIFDKMNISYKIKDLTVLEEILNSIN